MSTGLGRKVVHGAVWGQAGHMVAFTMQTLLQIVLARGLGSELYGLFAAVNGAVFLGVAIASAGASGTLNTHLSRLEHTHGMAAAAYLFWRVWMWRLLIFGVIALAAFTFSGPAAAGFLGDGDQGALMIAAAAYLVAAGMFQLANMLFYGLLKTKFAAVGQAASATVNVAVSTALIAVGASLTQIVIGLALGQVAVIAAQLARAWPYIRPSVGVREVAADVRGDVRGLWRFSLTVWGIALLTQALGKQTDIITMQLFRVPQEEIGFYNLAVTLALMANAVFLMGIGNVALAGMSSLNTRRPDKIGQGWRMLCSVSPLISIPILVFVGVFAEEVMTGLYGAEYGEATFLLQLFVCFIIVSQLLGGGAHQTTFTAMGMPRLTLKARAVTGILNLAVNVALIPFFGARGAVIGTGACGILTMAYEYAMVRRRLGERLPWETYGRASIAIVPGLGLAWLIAPHLGLVGVLGGGAVHLAAYVGMLLLLRPISVDPEMARALPRVARRVVRIESRAAPAAPIGSAPRAR